MLGKFLWNNGDSADAKMRDYILSFDKIQERLLTRPQDKATVLEYIKEIAHRYTENDIRRVKNILDATLIKLYDDIEFSMPANMDIKVLIQENNVVFVPNHQSHADYLLLNYILYGRYRIAAFIAGGVNLDIFPIGDLFRRAGCFFIRRTFKGDIIYKYTLEAYIAYLLTMQGDHPIEFFFEGGRSRDGKLMPPKFGLFQMLLEGHHKSATKPLVFIPVSIVHEYVPEQKSLAKELRGKKKKKENLTALLKLPKFLQKNFGTVHLSLSPPIPVTSTLTDFKTVTHQLAFDCYRAVGKAMMVTPSSILALTLLDDPSGVSTWQNMLDRTEVILKYCQHFHVPLSKSLTGEKWQEALMQALELFIKEKKIEKIHNERLNKTFYSIKEENRVEILYFKNTILHHFIVPFLVSMGWMNVFKGQVSTVNELKFCLLEGRKALKYEFYLPTIKELFYQGMDVVSYCIDRKVDGLNETLKLSSGEFYAIAKRIGAFASSFRYLYESYYMALLTIQHFGKQTFHQEQFLKTCLELFRLERQHGQMIKYPESYSSLVIKNALKLFENRHLIDRINGEYQVVDSERLQTFLDQYAEILSELLLLNIKSTRSEN